jgi:hypothetical protein
MKISAFTYNGESEMLRLHVGSLHKEIDHFFVVESTKTFSGAYKPLYYPRDKHCIEEWKNQVTHFVTDDSLSDYWDLARSSPNTVGAEHWKREFVQKEAIRDALQYLEDDDIVYIGDVDEIPDMRYVPKNKVEKLKLRVYAYYMDNRSSEEFWGPIVGRWKDIKGKCLNHIRSDVSLRNTEYAGWHFTSQGGYAELKRKLRDSYTSESYFTPEVERNLSYNYMNGVDFLGRNFTFKVDESEWPTYLKKHRVEYAHLCRGVGKFASHRRKLRKKDTHSQYNPAEAGD